MTIFLRAQQSFWQSSLAALCVVFLAEQGLAAPLILTPGQSITINTDTLAITGDATATGSVVGGAARFTFDDIILPNGANVTLTGSRVLSLRSLGNINVDTTLNASSTGQVGVLGGSNGGNQKTNGAGPGAGSTAGDCCFGGSGGGYGGAGGGNLVIGNPNPLTVIGTPGGTYGLDELPNVLGGSGAAGGGDCCGSSGHLGGAGGGGLDLAAYGTVTIGGNAQLLADGADGGFGNQNRSGGGGSGGAIRVFGQEGVDIAAGAILSASGGDSRDTNGNGGDRTGGAGGGGRIAIQGVTNNAGTVTVANGFENNTDSRRISYSNSQAGTVFSQNLVAQDSGYANAVLNDSPIAYWRLNETSGSVAFDIAGGHTGTYVGNPDLSAPGLQSPSSLGFEATNTAVGLDGSGDYVHVTGSNQVDFGGGSYSVEMIFQADYDQLSQNRDLFSAQGAGGHGVLLEIQPSGADRNLRFLHRFPFGSGGGQNIFYTLPGDGDAFYDQSHHLVGVFDDLTDEIILYLDGEEVGRTAATGNFDDELDVIIGALAASNRTRDFLGTIDEVAIYNSALSAAQVQAHFAAINAPEPTSVVVWTGLILLGTLVVRRRRK